MTTQELLEFAAKASGQYHGEWSDKFGALRMREGNRWIEWNPLKNNADAFRLMLDLNLILTHEWINYEKAPLATIVVRNEESTVFCRYAKYDNPHQAARVAITRVAAMIGVEMK
jgi:hypothetical protein